MQWLLWRGGEPPITGSISESMRITSDNEAVEDIPLWGRGFSQFVNTFAGVWLCGPVCGRDVLGLVTAPPWAAVSPGAYEQLAAPSPAHSDLVSIDLPSCLGSCSACTGPRLLSLVT